MKGAAAPTDRADDGQWDPLNLIGQYLLMSLATRLGRSSESHPLGQFSITPGIPRHPN
jgi:hypothetical protein